MADIRFERVRKSFGDFTAVDGVDLEVKDREFVVLLGPSGCGKTTLLRCLAGLERVDEGRVSIGGRDATDLPPRKRRIAMVFQSYAVFPHMKVYDNIAFGLRMQKEKKDVIDERVRSSASLLHIDSARDSKVCVDVQTCELCHAIDPIECTGHITLQRHPRQLRRACNGAKRQDEAVGYGGDQQRLGGPAIAWSAELLR